MTQMFDSARRFMPILAAADFARAKAENRFAVVLASQNADILDSGSISNSDDNIKNLQNLYKAGLRVLLITRVPSCRGTASWCANTQAVTASISTPRPPS